MRNIRFVSLLLLLFGGICQAQPVTNDLLSISRPSLLHATGEYGRPYIIQSADELNDRTTWSYVTNFNMPGIGSEFSMVAVATTNAQRFYRMVRDQVLADSVKDYSGVQGSNGWFYGYYVSPFTPAQFIPFNYFTNSSGPSDGWHPADLNVWTRAFQVGGHPNGTTTSGGKLHVEHWSVRRWKSPDTRTITATMYLRDLALGGGNGNGIIARVFLNGAEIMTYTLAEGTEHFQTITADVLPGSLMDFVIDPRDSNDLTDPTEFRILIY